jgi:hypothetical protein
MTAFLWGFRFCWFVFAGTHSPRHAYTRSPGVASMGPIEFRRSRDCVANSVHALPTSATSTFPMDSKRVSRVILHRAREQGYVRSLDIREELKRIGEPAAGWKDVIREAGPRLTLKNGRYYYVSPLRARLRETHRSRKDVKRAAGELIRSYKAGSVETERRNQRRIRLVLPVRVFSTNGKELQMLTQDVSLHGVRLLGPHTLRGQKAQVLIPSNNKGGGQWLFTVHFLWSTTVGDNLVESGGIFLEVTEREKGK